MWRIKTASGRAAEKARRTRDAISMTRASEGRESARDNGPDADLVRADEVIE
jgi:hypothetical protein